ncbi:MAG: hypothetical protein GF334_10525, partial [Candidatus Altiarchaeales archaeon]|nr:hypothetical protein [Candidatus Altiarchaeales archaeon]
PPKMRQWFLEQGYIVEGEGYMNTPKDKFLESLYETTDKRVEVSLKLMDEVEWDFFFLVLTGSDRLQHYMWRDMTEGEGEYKNAIKDFYIGLDQHLGDLMEKAGENTTVFVVSDHGFTNQDKRVHINHFLIKKGYMKLEGGFENMKKMWMLRVSAFLKQTGLSNLIIKVMRGTGGKPGDVKPPQIEVDYAESQAFTCGYYTGGIYLDNKLDPNTYLKVQSELVEAIKKELRDPDTGELIAEKVYTKQELYEGDQLSLSPDIIIIPKDGYWITGGISYPSLIEPTTKETGRHHIEGIWAVKGGGTKEGETVNAEIIDIAPTILKLFGLESDMDGRPIDAFKK